MDDYNSVWMDLLNVEFKKSWIDVKGVKTRVLMAGPCDAETVVMLPGTGGHLETFSRNIPAFAKEFRCVAIDMLGHGFTDKPEHPYEIKHYVQHLKDLLDTLEVKEASLFGVSLGAWVAIQFAITYPDRVRALCLASQPGMYANQATMQNLSSGRTSAVQEPTWERVRDVFKGLLLDIEKCSPDMIASRQAIYRQPQMLQTMPRILALQNYETRKRNLIDDADWKGIKAPALLIGSPDDPDEFLDTARRAAELMPNARMVEMKGVGHWPHYEDPATFNAIAVPFLLQQSERAR